MKTLLSRNIKQADEPLYGSVIKNRAIFLLSKLQQQRPCFVVKFPTIFSTLCVQFGLPKSDIWKLLFELRDGGLLKIVTNHGILIENQQTEDSLC